MLGAVRAHATVRRPRRSFSIAAVGILAWSLTAHGQTAADKATAREAATEGIRLHDAGAFEEALDRLTRAQALYDAPPHLLYIARCQKSLEEPRLVEAAETYRQLTRYALAPDAPDAFVSAVEAGRSELDELEHRIPKLVVSVEPSDVESLRVSLDGEELPIASLGLARPVNPGVRLLVAEAPGHVRVEREVSVEDGSEQSVVLVVEPAEDADGQAPEGGTDADAARRALFGFMLGLRLGVAVPGGKMGTFAGADREVSDAFGTGGGIELHGGVRIAELVTAALFAELSALSTPDGLEPLDGFDRTASARTLGFKVMIGTPRGRLGGFGEVGFGVSHAFELEATGLGGCQVKATAAGSVLRLGGGAVFPVGDHVHIVPFGALSVGSFSREAYEASGCGPAITGSLPAGRDIPGDEQGTHSLLFFGVGGDFVFGADTPRR
jgi:hypothetical protein